MSGAPGGNTSKGVMSCYPLISLNIILYTLFLMNIAHLLGSDDFTNHAAFAKNFFMLTEEKLNFQRTTIALS